MSRLQLRKHQSCRRRRWWLAPPAILLISFALSQQMVGGATSEPVFSPDARAGQVLHLTDVTLTETLGGLDPQNGQPSYGEHWILFDDAGQPLQLISEFRREDGAVFQTHTIDRHGASYSGISAGGPNDEAVWEVEDDSHSELLLKSTPRAQDPERLMVSGFSELAAADLVLPDPALSRASPLAIHTLETPDLRSFRRVDRFEDGGLRETVTTLDSRFGVMVETVMVSRDANGRVTNRYEYRRGVTELVPKASSPFDGRLVDASWQISRTAVRNGKPSRIWY